MIEPLQRDDVLLADISGTPREAGRLDLWWLGQSGYLVQHDRLRTVFDPYLSDSLTTKYAGTEKPHDRISGRVIEPDRLTDVRIVTSTHGHTDHLDAETLGPMFAVNPHAALVYAKTTQSLVDARLESASVQQIAMTAGDRAEFDDATVHAVAAAHDEIEVDEHGDHRYVGYVLETGVFTVYHSGDGVPYDGLAEALQSFDIDLAILPINGKVGNMNGEQAARLADRIGAELVVPCHYDMFAFNTADPNDQFVPTCEEVGQAYRVLELGQRLSLTQSD
ncbi:MAG: hypothetical protein CMJ49_10200 [Planctomycetaceae bacterium]|nr:hypothetical protein [Planctomycetaceae bacterium]